MIQEEKQLLTVDVCSRLPYGVKVWDETSKNSYRVVIYDPDKREVGIRHMEDSKLKPILFPISYITKEITVNGNRFVPIVELSRMKLIGDPILPNTPSDNDEDYYTGLFWQTYNVKVTDVVDKLNQWMIDYRGLIEKGLAVSVFSLSENPYK